MAPIITCYLSGESIASQMSWTSSSGQLDIVEIILIESQMYHVQSWPHGPDGVCSDGSPS
ncbi:MAG: hypothetical protein ABSF89_12475 [Acidimicrobiales bacterium]